MLRVLVSGLIAAALAWPAEDAYQSAARKFALIEEDRAPAGARIWISVQELNAYAAVGALEVVPKGLRSPRLVLGQGSAIAYARVDLLKVQELKGSPPPADGTATPHPSVPSPGPQRIAAGTRRTIWVWLFLEQRVTATESVR